LLPTIIFIVLHYAVTTCHLICTFSKAFTIVSSVFNHTISKHESKQEKDIVLEMVNDQKLCSKR